MAQRGGDMPVFIDVSQTTDQYQVPVEYNSQDVTMSSEPLKNELGDTNQELEQPTTDVSKPQDESNPCLTIQPRRIKCPECNRYTAENEEKMLRHIRKVHRGENPFQCYMCDYSTYNKALFEEHVRIHQGIKPFKCSSCPYRSASKKNTKKHELIHRADNPLKCEACPFIARHSRALVCHKLKHAYKCSKCPFVGKNQKDIDAHKESSKCEKWYVCDRCFLRFPDVQSKANHRKNARKCDICQEVFCGSSMLKKHRASEHQISSQSNRQFECSLCKWKSLNKARVLLHLIHHPNQKVDETIYDLTVLRKYGIMK